MDKKSIGIIGYGFVGRILRQYYPDALVWDNCGDIEVDDLEDVLDCDVIFIAFNAKDNAIDGHESIGEYCAASTDGRVFIIKSTFVPGTTDKLQAEFPQHKFVYNPEFLTEMTAWEDFTMPQFQILGVPHQSYGLIHELFDLLPDAPVKKIISPLDAETLKHAQNSYYATKVIFFNELYDICEQLGADYETIREILVQNPWIGDSHSKIFHKGYRGFGGKCLPKDTRALSQVAKSKLLDVVQEINNTLRS